MKLKLLSKTERVGLRGGSGHFEATIMVQGTGIVFATVRGRSPEEAISRGEKLVAGFNHFAFREDDTEELTEDEGQENERINDRLARRD